MEFTFETNYDMSSLTTMAKALRKTVRKKHNTRSRVLGWIVFALAVLLVYSNFKNGFDLSPRIVLTLIAAVCLFVALLFEDKLNAYIARKRMLAGTEFAKTVFTDESFISETAVGKTIWNYDKILLLAENADHFIFVFSNNHAQVYDKKAISGGTLDEFCAFICDITQKSITYIK